eukprot:466193-Pyramimonas_sp.AAC.1
MKPRLRLESITFNYEAVSFSQSNPSKTSQTESVLHSHPIHQHSTYHPSWVLEAHRFLPYRTTPRKCKSVRSFVSASPIPRLREYNPCVANPIPASVNSPHSGCESTKGRHGHASSAKIAGENPNSSVGVRENLGGEYQSWILQCETA